MRTPDDFVRFVNEVGCCTSTALPGYPDFPNQYEVMGEHDSSVPDPWFWKDDLHEERRLYYSRVFGGRPGFISIEMLPVFVATNGAAYDELVFSGLMSPEAKEIYHSIEMNGPIGTKNLKKLLSADAKRAAERVLIELDRKFLITKTGITGRTMHTYSYIWDLAERWMPDMLATADRLGRREAMKILRKHLEIFGIPPDSPFYSKVLGWTGV